VKGLTGSIDSDCTIAVIPLSQMHNEVQKVRQGDTSMLANYHHADQLKEISLQCQPGKRSASASVKLFEESTAERAGGPHLILVLYRNDDPGDLALSMFCEPKFTVETTSLPKEHGTGITTIKLKTEKELEDNPIFYLAKSRAKALSRRSTYS